MIPTTQKITFNAKKYCYIVSICTAFTKKIKAHAFINLLTDDFGLLVVFLASKEEPTQPYF